MTTTYTPIWRVPILAPLDPLTSGTWGAILSAAQGLMEIGAVGIPGIDLTGQTAVTLSIANDAPDQARQSTYPFTGALTGLCTVTIPNIQRWGFASNSTTGGFGVVLTTGSGTTITLPPDGELYLWQCGGSNNITLPTLGNSAANPQNTWRTIATYVLSNASSQAIPLSTAYRRFRLTAQNATVSNNGATIDAQLSSNGGASYVTSAAYDYALFSVLTSGPPSSGSSTTGTAMLLTPNLQAPASGHSWDGVTQIFPGALGTAPKFTTDGTGSIQSGIFARVMIGAGLEGAGALYNFMNLLPSAGTFSGTFILEGLL